VGAAISVLLVAATVGVLLAVFGHDAGGDVSLDKSVPQSPPPRAATPSAAPSPVPTVEPSPAATVAPSAAPSSAAPVPHPALTVLNNSTVRSLAADAAGRFRAAGWPVALVGDITGRYRYTTVYYGPGQLAAARALVRQFPGIRVIDSRANVPELPGTGLTVVVTKDFR
jgi:hypothetical protein